MAKRREAYSTASPAAQEKGKEVEREWYSFMGCCSCGTGHSVSLFLELNENDPVLLAGTPNGVAEDAERNRGVGERIDLDVGEAQEMRMGIVAIPILSASLVFATLS